MTSIIIFLQLTTFRFKVEEEKISLFLEGKSLAERIEEDKIFYIDYQDLEEYIAPITNTVIDLINEFCLIS